ncbi:hypothetical protein J7L05_01790 [bacterium]|nr:hypothetical protein [bacterium]
MVDQKKVVFWDHQISTLILDSIETANKQIIIVTPYIKLWNHLQDQLESAKKRGIRTVLYFRHDVKETNINDVMKYFDQVIPIKNLHAKLYFIDDEIIVSSMNLYDYSQKSNKEIALRIVDQNQKNALQAYLDTKLKPFAERIKKQTTKKKPQKQSTGYKTKTGKTQKGDAIGTLLQSAAAFLGNQLNDSGTCIRCGANIDFDPSRPFCNDCYKKWAKYKNEDFTEKYCHDCGKKHKTSMAKPLCYECYKNN